MMVDEATPFMRIEMGIESEGKEIAQLLFEKAALDHAPIEDS